MISLHISLRKPRTGDYTIIESDNWFNETIAGIKINIRNSREKPIYLKWRI